MILRETEVSGCYIVEPERREDERGFFARTFSTEEFEAAGLNPTVTQCSVSYNRRERTLRGLHYQEAPHAEAKLVRCTRGRVFDVAVDLRAGSRTYAQWTAVELSDSNHLAMYIPEECAHGFLTLVPECELLYQISVAFRGEASRGVRWDDPALAIAWPAAPEVMSGRDRELPSLASLRRA